MKNNQQERSVVSNKRLLFLTSTRADFGKIEPLALSARQAGFHITFFITGMHMMKRYGDTRQEVKRFQGATFFEFVNQREGDSLDLILSKTILGFSDFICEHSHDLVVIHGDRVEALAASIVCAMHYIRTAHIEGGEVSGTLDESMRHCNTKLCTTHFVSNDSARERVLCLGESPHSVFKIGSPELDTHAQPSGISIEKVKLHYEIPFDTFGVAIFHPVTSEENSIKAQARSFFSTLEETSRPFVVIAPNNDPGSSDIFSIIERLPSSHFRIIPSMRFSYFSELLRNAAVMVGNSSAGVREAPYLGLPSLDVGTRQNERASSESVSSCSPFDQDGIRQFIERYWGVRFPTDKAFGDGDSAGKFSSIICQPSFWALQLQKRFCSHPQSFLAN